MDEVEPWRNDATPRVDLLAGHTFAWDVSTHLRFLIGLPSLLVVETVAHESMQPVIRQFLVRGIVPPEAESRFRSILATLMRLRDSPWSEISILALTPVVGQFIADRTALHPDRAAGLSFLSRAVRAYVPSSIAISAIMAGVLAGEVLYEGAAVPAFRLEAGMTVVLVAIISLGPLCVLTPLLVGARVRVAFTRPRPPNAA